MNRLTKIAAVALAGAIATGSLVANAQEWPKQKPVQLVVGFAPGSSTDIVARLVAQKLSELLGQGVVVENKGGAGGNIAAQLVKNAAPNGYTLLVTSVAYAVNPSLYPNAGYDPIEGFRSDHPGRQHAQHHHGESRGSGQKPDRAHCPGTQGAACRMPPQASGPRPTSRWSA